MNPEFSRPQRLDQIGAGENEIHITADAAERDALAERFGWQAVDALDSRLTLRRDAVSILATGHLSARVTQTCVATGDPLPVAVEEDFAIRFLPEPDEATPDEDIELSEDACDTVFYTGSAIDLGEAAAETLALSLDPFPRGPNAATVLKQAGVLSEDEAGPLSPFAGLKDKLAGK
ncbi:YceD family protein [Sphingomonas sp. CJ20]